MICKTCHGSGAVATGAREAPPGSGLDAIYDYGKCPNCDGPFVLTDMPLVRDLLSFLDIGVANGVFQHEESNIIEAMTALGYSDTSIPLTLHMMYSDNLTGRQIRDTLWGSGCSLKEEDTYEPPPFD